MPAFADEVDGGRWSGEAGAQAVARDFTELMAIVRRRLDGAQPSGRQLRGGAKRRHNPVINHTNGDCPWL